MFLRKCLILVCVSLLTAVPVKADDVFGTRLVVEKPPDSEYALLPSAMSQDTEITVGELYGDALYRLNVLISDAVWSPDGTQVAVMGEQWNICTVPAEGGYPELIMGNTYEPYEEYLVRMPIEDIICFSPDGSEIYFRQKCIVDDTEISITESFDGLHGSIDNPGYKVSAVNVGTGEIRTVLEDGWWVWFSSSGRYMVKIGESTTTVVDTQTGTEYANPFYASKCIFNADETTLLYADTQNDAIMRVPMDGSGDPEVFAEIPGDLISYHIEMTPDGKWILCTIGTGPRDGDTWSTDNFSNVQAYNIENGELISVVPLETAVESEFISLTADGTRITYLYSDGDAQPGEKYLIYTRDLPEAITGNTPTAVAETAPESFAIHGAYPNPFNPATTIAFSFPERQQVELAVYNLAGQKIRTLAGGVFAGGRHEIVWNGRDDSGMPAASGMYFARLTNGSYSVVQRMTLMK